MPKHKGGFHDPASLRSELGLSEVEMPDDQAWKVIYDDMKTTKEMEEKQRIKAQDELQNLKNNKLNLQSDLEIERNKRRQYENLLNPYNLSSDPIYLSKFLEKERMKREIKREMEEEQAIKRENQRWLKQINSTDRRARSASRSKKSTKKKTKKAKKTKKSKK